MSTFLIKDVRIFDGKETLASGAVLVEDGKIKQVASVIEFSGTTISRPGHTLLPGLIDCHIHADSGNREALTQSLRFGVTTVCDMHNEYHNVIKLRKQLAEDPHGCADLKEASIAATVEMGWPAPVVLRHSTDPNVEEEVAAWPKLEKPEDAAGYIRDRIVEKVDYIKLMHESGKVMGAKFNMPSIELQKALIAEAKKAGLVVVAHSLCLEDTIDILEAGVDGMTHTFLDEPPSERLIAAYKKNGAHCNPTLATIGSGTAEGKQLQEKYAHDPRVVPLLLGEGTAERLCACMAFARSKGSTVENAYESVRQLKANGIDVVLGSDAAGPAVGTAYGVTLHHEAYLFVRHCGFTPAEALAAGTSVVARRFGFHDRGQIKEGLRADLLLVEGNPLSNIDDTLNIRAVWKEGVLTSFYSDKL